MREDTGKRAGCQVVGRFARNCDAPGFYQMLELAMAAACCSKKPSVFLDHAHDVSYFHELPDSLANLMEKEVPPGLGGNPLSATGAHDHSLQLRLRSVYAMFDEG